MRRRSRFSNILRLSIIAIVALGGGFLSVFLYQNLAKKNDSQALSATEFQPGRIIDDSIFYNPNTMTAAEIDAFIDSHSPACDMWGNGYSFGGVQNKEYARRMREAGNSRWHEPPYVCISEFYENPETHVTNFETNGVKQDGMLSAGEIIYKAAQTYNVNPQVLLVMLKKESYAWGDDWPLKWEYNTVMGYACPDGAPCNEEYFGFYNQMMTAAWQLNYYREHIYSYNYRPYATNNILYNPDRSCGSKPVYLENIATTSLYIYTPYVPNDDALANYPGTSWCGSYGNRNFYMYFREWFGGTLANVWDKMATPRYLKTKDDVSTINIVTQKTEELLPPGSVFYYREKTYLPSGMCLKISSTTCVLFSDTEEVKWEWIPMETPRFLSAENSTKVISPTTLSPIRSASKNAYYDRKIILPDDTQCLSERESTDDSCVIFNNLSDTKWTPIEMSYPRKLAGSNGPMALYNPNTLAIIDTKNEPLYFSSIIDTPSGRLVCTDNPSSGCAKYNETREVIENINTPRELILISDSVKYNSSTNEPTSFVLGSGMIRKYVRRTYYRSDSDFFPCLQTEYDTELNTTDCINYNLLSETESFLPNKKRMRVTSNTNKYFYGLGGPNMSYPLDSSVVRYFEKKSFISTNNGDVDSVCLLTEFDVAYNTKSCIKESDLVSY